MQFESTKRIAFWQGIGSPITNVARQRDSDPKSSANLSLQEAMQVSGGWSEQFPAVLVKMSNWPFHKSSGVSAKKFVDDENIRRAKEYEALKANVAAEGGPIALRAFCDLFCNKKDVLHVLTVENSYWVHSGHQRFEMVYLPAYTLYLIRLAGRAKADPENSDTPVVVDWQEGIPALIGTYTDEMDILRDQLSANASASEQNKLTAFDYLKGAVSAIGKLQVPAVKERAFRNMCALPGSVAGAKGSSGAAPRIAYLLGLINFSYAGKLKFYELLTNQAKKTNEVTKEEYGNPDYIDISKFYLLGEDWRYNVSVIVRLMEPGLERLKAYVSGYGAGCPASASSKPGWKDPVSAVEYAILKRNKCWSEEEANAWIESVKPNNPVKSLYKPPQKTEKDKPFDVSTLTNVVQSDSSSDYLRDVLAKFIGVPRAAGEEINKDADARAMLFNDPINAIWKLDLDDKYQKMLADVITAVGGLREGSPKDFQKVVTQFKDVVDKVTTPAK